MKSNIKQPINDNDKQVQLNTNTSENDNLWSSIDKKTWTFQSLPPWPSKTPKNEVESSKSGYAACCTRPKRIKISNY